MTKNMEEDFTNEEKSAIMETEDEKTKFLVPIAQEILKIVGENSAFLGEESVEQRETYYKEINSKVLDLLMEKDICFTDRNFIFTLMLQAYESVHTVVDNSLRKSYEMACTKAFGKKDMLDIKLSDIDTLLKS